MLQRSTILSLRFLKLQPISDGIVTDLTLKTALIADNLLFFFSLALNVVLSYPESSQIWSCLLGNCCWRRGSHHFHFLWDKPSFHCSCDEAHHLTPMWTGNVFHHTCHPVHKWYFHYHSANRSCWRVWGRDYWVRKIWVVLERLDGLKVKECIH